jgi:hypothetical protein
LSRSNAPVSSLPSCETLVMLPVASGRSSTRCATGEGWASGRRSTWGACRPGARDETVLEEEARVWGAASPVRSVRRMSWYPACAPGTTVPAYAAPLPVAGSWGARRRAAGLPLGRRWSVVVARALVVALARCAGLLAQVVSTPSGEGDSAGRLRATPARDWRGAPSVPVTERESAGCTTAIPPSNARPAPAAAGPAPGRLTPSPRRWSGVAVAIGTPCSEPPVIPGLAAIPGDGSVAVEWWCPGSDRFAACGVVALVRKRGSGGSTLSSVRRCSGRTSALGGRSCTVGG